MDRQTGGVTLTSALDREVMARYNLVAVATDENGAGLSSYVDVFIFVEDINDNPPSFPGLIYEGSVLENQPPGE